MRTEKKKQWLAIITFYAVAMACRAIAMKIEPTTTVGIRYLLRGWAEGMGPCIGALLAVLLFKRRFFCSITGISVIRSALSMVIPFCVCLFFNQELSFVLLGFLFYSFLEEVGWRGYLQGEFKGMSDFSMSLIVGTLWFVWHLRFQFSLSALIFLAILVFGSWGIGRIAKDTHSLIACACFHTLYNFSTHGFFQFTPAVICIYGAIVSSWFAIWYIPWAKLAKTE